MLRDANALASSSIARGLPKADLERLRTAGAFERYRAGDAIMKEGETSDAMYLFLEGTVDISRSLTLKIAGRGFENAEKSMTRLKADSAAVFGEMSLFMDAPRSATVTAVTDCLLFSLSRKAYEGLCAASPALGLSLTRAVASILSFRLRKSNDDVLKLSTALSIALSR